MKSNYLSGHDAEKRAAEHLKSLGFKVRALNWKTRYCEIDIVAEKAKAIYFVEVKYRRSSRQGSGLEYITLKKLSQMRFAAEMWVQEHRWEGAYQLAAISIDGNDITLVEDI